MRIVLVASEVVPFAKTGGLADVCGALPLALEQLGHEVSVIMPGYRCVSRSQPFNARANVTVIGRDVRVYFLRQDAYYGRPRLYGDERGDYPDNLERFVFLCQETFHLLKDIGKPVDIIHCHDWQTGLVPVLMKEQYRHDPFFQNTRSVFTAHNMAYQGLFPHEGLPRLGVDRGLFDPSALEFYGKINLLKAGLVFADRITTVSPEYAKEIQTQEWGCGLDGVIRQRKDCLDGILNGLDYVHWDPATDVFLDPPYVAKDVHLKDVHKENLQNVFHLPVFKDIPVFGFVGRLCYQKGFDLIEAAFDGLMQRPLQVVFIGIGDEKYEKMIVKLARKYPHQCASVIRYDEDIAHEVYAGSDLFLMPSVYEPCGLTQMIGLRYGTIPLVNGVGGLRDTVVDHGSHKKQGNGFVMENYSVEALLGAVDRALGLFHQKERWDELRAHAMACRWTWDVAARQYNEVFRLCSESA